MSVSYTQLMAMSQAQTEAADAALQTVLAQRQQKLDAQRKEQEAREKRDREIETRIRLKRLEEDAREQERLARKEQEREARERVIAQKEAEKRDILLHGPKRAKSEQARAGDRPDGDRTRTRRSSASPEPGNAMTREELRQQKRAAELKRVYAESSGSRRSSTPSSSHSHKSRRQLRGGAVAIVTSTPGLPAGDPASSGQSVKERIAAVPLTLTKLNLVKRDLRTIDEIMMDRDRERARKGEVKVISGDEAKEFSDWFSKSKKKDNVVKRDATPPSAPSTPPIHTDTDYRSKAASRSPAPSAFRDTGSIRSSPAMFTASAKASPVLPKAKSQATASSGSTLKRCDSKASSSKLSSSLPTKSPLSVAKKRPRSPSLTPEPAPKRRPGSSRPASYLPDDIFSLITGGRNRDHYAKPVDLSDDSDMEADVASQEREEIYSARIARREDEEALQEIKRHEEEKRRRKNQRNKERMS